MIAPFVVAQVDSKTVSKMFKFYIIFAIVGFIGIGIAIYFMHSFFNDAKAQMDAQYNENVGRMNNAYNGAVAGNNAPR